MADEGPTVTQAPGNHRTDSYAQKLDQKVESWQRKRDNLRKKPSSKPAGGFDETAIPSAPPGYTLKFTFHRARHLPFADLNTLSSDPYVSAQLKVELPTRHKQDPLLQYRSRTIQKTVEPEWNAEWIVANVPASGFEMKIRLYDEDPSDHDDRLGNVHIHVNGLSEQWPGIKEETFKIEKRSGSKRAYFLRGCWAVFNRGFQMTGEMVVSVELLGRTVGNYGGRVWTVGPCSWTRHFSPMIGMMVGTKDPGEEKGDGKPRTEKYDFQANQVQLAGPVPGGLYHRYVEFKPFIAGMFESNSIRGRILNRALHHQHTRIYNYDRQTVYGSFPEPCREMTLKFLELAHYDKGGRIFTYIITLDGKWRFTETGKEFGIDLLSKHTMHSDVNVYIAFSGEFFIRRHQQPQAKHENSHRSDAAKVDASPTHPPDEISGGPPKEDPPKDPAYYSLVIDNDSGTYRPNAKLLPELKAFLHKQLPGLHIMTLDCNGDKEKMEKLKGEQRDRKKKEGKRMVVRQQRSMSDLGSVSSSDEEDLEQQVRDYEGTGADATKEKGVKAKLAAKMHDTKEKATGHGYDEKAHADSVAPTTEQTVPSLNEKTTLPATRDPNSDMDTITPTTNGEVKSS